MEGLSGFEERVRDLPRARRRRCCGRALLVLEVEPLSGWRQGHRRCVLYCPTWGALYWGWYR
ncbi:MAG: hypothetical protein QME87_09770 [Bacillota bacterium]|nr:hypothetical protein [Bacillota bacterium]